MAEDLLIERRDRVLWLTINREAQRNTISPAVLDGLSAGFDQAQTDRDLRAVVVTGAGDRAFCAGGDLQSANPFAVDYSTPYAGAAQLFRKARQATVPLIARVNGACMAGGMGLLGMCDLAVADSRAIFGLPEVKVGVFPAQVLAVLQHLVPRRRLAELCLLGDPLSAVEARELGLVNVVADDLDAALGDMLDRLLDRSPAALRRGLYTLKKMDSMPFEESLAFAESQIALLAMTEDAKEGQRAFREKRRPIWPGK